MNERLDNDLNAIVERFMLADKLVVPSLSKNPTQEEINNMDKSFTNFYHAVDEIRSYITSMISENYVDEYDTT